MASVVSELLAYADILALVVAAALYLTDLGKWLFVNELLFAGAVGTRSIVRPGDAGIEIAGRYAHFPLALTPGAIVLRTTWPATATRCAGTADVIDRLEQCLIRLRVPRVICTLLLPQLFIGIPLLYWLGNANAAVALLLVIYLQLIILLLWLVCQHRALGLSIWATLGLCFESFVCIPYAPNLHRKLADRMLADINSINAEKLAKALLLPKELATYMSRS